MKRDMDLVRRIMLELSDSRHPLDAGLFTDERHDYQDVAHHIEMMQEAGLIKAMLQPGDDCWYAAAAADLTWKGHEFADASRDAKIWKKALRAVSKQVASAPFTVIVELLNAQLMGQLGLN